MNENHWLNNGSDNLKATPEHFAKRFCFFISSVDLSIVALPLSIGMLNVISGIYVYLSLLFIHCDRICRTDNGIDFPKIISNKCNIFICPMNRVIVSSLKIIWFGLLVIFCPGNKVIVTTWCGLIAEKWNFHIFFNQNQNIWKGIIHGFCYIKAPCNGLEFNLR